MRKKIGIPGVLLLAALLLTTLPRANAAAPAGPDSGRMSALQATG